MFSDATIVVAFIALCSIWGYLDRTPKPIMAGIIAGTLVGVWLFPIP